MNCEDESSTRLEAAGMLARLEGVGADVSAGGATAAGEDGDVDSAGVPLLWNLLKPAFRALVPFSVLLLDLAVNGSVGIRGPGGKLSLRGGGCAVAPCAEEGRVVTCDGVISGPGINFGTGGS
jgi:hypothetical protein